MKKKFILLSTVLAVIISAFTFCFGCNKVLAAASNQKVEDIFGNGCEVSPIRYEDGVGFIKPYHCKNRNYLFFKKGFVSIDLNPGYEFWDCKDPHACIAVGFIRYDYNFNRYYCAYKWDQRDTYCNMGTFIMEMKKYLKMQ